MDTGLYEAERRAALIVDHGNLAVQNRTRGVDVMRQNAELGVLLRAAVAAARIDLQLAVFDETDGSDAVPFDFVQPLVACGRRGGERSHHGRDGVRHCGFDSALQRLDFKVFF